MPLDNAAILKQIDDIFARIDLLTHPSQYDDYSDLRPPATSEAVSLMTSTIERLAPAGSSFHKNAKHAQVTSYFAGAIGPLMGVLKALRLEYEKGYLQSIQEFVHA